MEQHNNDDEKHLQTNGRFVKNAINQSINIAEKKKRNAVLELMTTRSDDHKVSGK